jgi:hypothetical protein
MSPAASETRMRLLCGCRSYPWPSCLTTSSSCAGCPCCFPKMPRLVLVLVLVLVLAPPGHQSDRHFLLPYVRLHGACASPLCSLPASLPPSLPLALWGLRRIAILTH